MKKECSYGIIPLKYEHNRWMVLLIQHHSGHWSFPKGHPEEGELPLQSAERELREETGLSIKQLLSPDPMTEKYSFIFKGERIEKMVHYFPALVEGSVILQTCEIKSSHWIRLSEAHLHITFQEGKRICRLAVDFIKTLDKSSFQASSNPS